MNRTLLASSVLAVVSLAACRSDPPARVQAEQVAPTTSSSAAVAVGAVIIDRSDAAYTVFTRIPEQAAEADLARVREWLQAQPSSSAVAWSDFEATTDTLVPARLRKDDYPECGVPRGIAALLEKYPGSPFGVTWNGGIAFTFNDYQHAKALLARWEAAPTTLTRPRDPRADPIHPQGHLVPLLGR